MGTITVNNSTSNSQTLNITVPASLVPETEGLPRYYWYNLLGGENLSSPTGKVAVFPHKSQIIQTPPYIIGIASPSTYTIDANTEKIFIKDTALSGENKWTFSAFGVSSGLDVNLALVQDTSTSFSIVSNVVKNDNGAGGHERVAYTGSGTFSNIYLRVGKVSGTGTFKAAGMSNLYTPFYIVKPSCAGGTGIFANRCVDYLDGDPGSTPTCIALQGTGSTYSSFSCTSTNRIARCFSNPLLTDTRAVVSFYSSSDTTATASSACGSDILLTTP